MFVAKAAVIARLVQAIQYSRGSSDSIEGPRRTGSPAFAGDDTSLEGPTLGEPYDISIFFRTDAPITSMPRVPIRCVNSITALYGPACGRPMPFWRPTTSMAV